VFRVAPFRYPKKSIQVGSQKFRATIRGVFTEQLPNRKTWPDMEAQESTNSPCPDEGAVYLFPSSESGLNPPFYRLDDFDISHYFHPLSFSSIPPFEIFHLVSVSASAIRNKPHTATCPCPTAPSLKLFVCLCFFQVSSIQRNTGKSLAVRTCFGSWLYLVLRRYVMSRRSTPFGQMFHSLYLSAYCVLHRYAVQYVKAFPPEHPCSTDGHISVRTIDQIAFRMEPLYSLFSPTNDHISRSTCVSSHSSPSY
jgi:hypothetical protein